MYAVPTDKNAKAVRATEAQRDILLLSFKASPSPSKAELALLSFQTNLEMDWINRWFMRQRRAERRRTAPPKSPKPAGDCVDLTVKRELVDAQVTSNGSSDPPRAGRRLLLAKDDENLPAKEKEEEEDSSSTHIPSSPTRYSVASSLPPSSSPPSSPPPAHIVKPSSPAPYRDAASKPTSRILRCVPYEDPRARLSNTPKVQASGASAPPLPTAAPECAYAPQSSRHQSPQDSPAANPMSATLSARWPAAPVYAHIAPKPAGPPAHNPYLPRGPTSPAVLPVSKISPPSGWQQYLQASTPHQAPLATSHAKDTPRKFDSATVASAPIITPVWKTSATTKVLKATLATEQEISLKTQEMFPLLDDLEQETDVAKIALLLAKLRRLGLQW